MHRRKLPIVRTSAETEAPEDAQSAYDGRHHLGWTVQRGRLVEAIRFDRVSLGRFDNVLQARNALWCDEGVVDG